MSMLNKPRGTINCNKKNYTKSKRITGVYACNNYETTLLSEKLIYVILDSSETRKLIITLAYVNTI